MAALSWAKTIYLILTVYSFGPTQRVLTIVQFTCMSLCIPVFTIIRVHSDTNVNVGTYVNNTINTA